MTLLVNDEILLQLYFIIFDKQHVMINMGMMKFKIVSIYVVVKSRAFLRECPNFLSFLFYEND